MEKARRIACIWAVVALMATSAMAQAEQSASGTGVMAEVKQDVISSKTYTSIFMIAGVVAIVGLAIYLSFSNEQEKTPAKK